MCMEVIVSRFRACIASTQQTEMLFAYIICSTGSVLSMVLLAVNMQKLVRLVRNRRVRKQKPQYVSESEPNTPEETKATIFQEK